MASLDNARNAAANDPVVQQISPQAQADRTDEQAAAEVDRIHHLAQQAAITADVIVVPPARPVIQTISSDPTNPDDRGTYKNLALQGGLLTLKGPSKSGKSTILAGIIAAALSPGMVMPHAFKFHVPKEMAGRKILHFDTEQGNHYFHKTIVSALQRAGCHDGTSARRPDEYRPYDISLTPDADRLALIKYELERHPDTFLVLIDGIADLVNDFNNLDESRRVVDTFRRWAIEYDHAQVHVIHENEGAANRKARGHLGTLLHNKSETTIETGNLSPKDLEKNDAPPLTKEMRVPQSRGAGYIEPLLFNWNHKLKMATELSKIKEVIDESAHTRQQAKLASYKQSEIADLGDFRPDEPPF